MKLITVVSLGPGSRACLTLGALEAMEKAEKLILRTENATRPHTCVKRGYPLKRWTRCMRNARTLMN